MNRSYKIKKQKITASLLVYAIVLLLTMFPYWSSAQTDSTKKEETVTTEEAAPAEESSLISPALDMVSVQKGDNSIDLAVAVRAKIKGSFIKLRLLKINFLQVTDDGEKPLGFLITDAQGKAVFNVKADSLKPGADGKLHFKAVYAGNKQLDPAEGEVAFKRAALQITPIKEDTLLTVKVKLADMSSGTAVPVPEAVLGLFVQRSFKPLKIGEGTTDENGEATIAVPANLPGDAKGNLGFLVKLEENETYGNLETAVAQNWGIPVSNQLHELPRSLWSEHPPYWMMITFIILMGTVWGHYLVIIIQLFRLRKEEPSPDSPLVEHINRG